MKVILRKFFSNIFWFFVLKIRIKPFHLGRKYLDWNILQTLAQQSQKRCIAKFGIGNYGDRISVTECNTCSGSCTVKFRAASLMQKGHKVMPFRFANLLNFFGRSSFFLNLGDLGLNSISCKIFVVFVREKFKTLRIFLGNPSRSQSLSKIVTKNWSFCHNSFK